MTTTNIPELLPRLLAENQRLACIYCENYAVVGPGSEYTIEARNAWWRNYRQIAAITGSTIADMGDQLPFQQKIPISKPEPYIRRAPEPRAIQKRHKRHPKQDEICTCYREGWSQDAVRRQFGLSHQALVSVLEAGDVAIRSRSESMRKATDEQIAEALRADWNARTIEVKMHCSRYRIYEIRRAMAQCA